MAKERGPIDTEFRADAPEYAVIIPTLNAEKYIDALLKSLLEQTLSPREIWVVDSDSDDATAQRAAAYPRTRVVTIRREEFDHGGTRDMVIRRSDAPFVVLMTQDALPMDAGCMAQLLEPFGDADVAAVCARQVARPDALAREKAVRAFRYPDESFTWTRADVGRMGIRSYLLSDVCAAYRREAYLEVGGFTHPLRTNEDMLMAAELLEHGYRLAYQDGARVWHSHNYTPQQEYNRNRLIGAFLAQYGDRFESGELGEGLRMVKAVSRQLLRRGDIIGWLGFGVNCAARMLGNRAGRRGSRHG